MRGPASHGPPLISETGIEDEVNQITYCVFNPMSCRSRKMRHANFLGGPNDSGVQDWLKQTGQAGLGVQATIVPHFGLGIPRLESFEEQGLQSLWTGSEQ